ncbi:hypothetical protein Tco_1029027 [Tanacetum coccineum]|uniref:Reverse transcriptase domain-containing protein n=1 Tax=Tanacetum coccineum TaxID=301880 RepID=A0ABQ5G2H5_9ASTR
MQKQNPSGSGSLPINTVANPRGDSKAITTRSGVAYDGPTIPPTPSPLPKEVERETKATKDKVLHFDISFADALLHMPKFASTFKSLLMDYDVDPRVPLILGRPFLRMARALVDVYDEELILRDGDEQLIFHTDTTSKYSNKHRIESVKMINFIDISCEDNFKEELKIKKLSHHLSAGTTSTLDSSLSLTPVETSDSLFEEFADELALLDQFPLGIGDADFDPEGDILLLENLLNDDPSSPLPPKELNFEELKMIKSLIDDFPPLDVLGRNFVTFSNPLFDANDDFTSSDDESPPEADVLEDIESEDSYVSNHDEPALLVTPFFDANEDECFDPGGDIDEIDAFLDINVEDDYRDSKGDIIYLENLLNNDTIPYLPPKVFLDHDSRSLKDELDNNDLKRLPRILKTLVLMVFVVPNSRSIL